jgi:chromosomal replication initiator protein
MATLWKRVLERLGHELGVEATSRWLHTLQVVSQDGELILYAPNEITRAFVQSNYLARIDAVARHFDPKLAKLVLIVGSAHIRSDGNERAGSQASTPEASIFEDRLDARFRFDNFVEGASNRLARATAMQVAQTPGQPNTNPFVMYGGTGLGKTHLMHATGNLMRQRDPKARVLYVRSEEFISQMVRALRNSTLDDFKTRYRTVDALLIDDIQFFAGKDRTQEEFFHTFESLYDNRQQIIMTCDRYPRELEKIEQRLRSRFGSGISVAVDPPDYETRLAILQSKAEEYDIVLDEGVLGMLAKRMHSNVRELEGALHTLNAHANFLKRRISLEFAVETLRDRLGAAERALSIGSIQQIVAQLMRVSLADLVSQKRKRPIVQARAMAMALAKELTQLSYADIGREFGDRDHSTVMHSCKQVRDRMKTDTDFFESWQEAVRRLSL